MTIVLNVRNEWKQEDGPKLQLLLLASLSTLDTSNKRQKKTI